MTLAHAARRDERRANTHSSHILDGFRRPARNIIERLHLAVNFSTVPRLLFRQIRIAIRLAYNGRVVYRSTCGAMRFQRANHATPRQNPNRTRWHKCSITKKAARKTSHAGRSQTFLKRANPTIPYQTAMSKKYTTRRTKPAQTNENIWLCGSGRMKRAVMGRIPAPRRIRARRHAMDVSETQGRFFGLPRR